MLASICNWHLLDWTGAFEYLVISYNLLTSLYCCHLFSSGIIFFSIWRTPLRFPFVYVCCWQILSVSDHMKMSSFYLLLGYFHWVWNSVLASIFFSAQRTHSTAFFLPVWSTSQVVPVWGNIPRVFKTSVLWMVHSPL